MLKFLAARAALLAFALGLFALGASADPADDQCRTLPNDYILGDAAAPMCVIHYNGYSCKNCAEYFQNDFTDVLAKYVFTGKVRYIWREYPISPSARNTAAVLSARCVQDKAGNQAYLEFIAKLFTNRLYWGSQGNVKQQMADMAAEWDFTRESLEACWTRADIRSGIEAEMLEATEHYGIKHFPAFILNGELIDLPSEANSRIITAIFMAKLDDRLAEMDP